MESVVLRAIWLTVLIGGMLPCIASEITEPTMTTNPDFTVTIPKGGLPQDVEEVFFLQPSQILRVIDETTKAVYMPQKNTESERSSQETRATPEAPSTEIYSTAYAFVNGECDFKKEIEYKEAFLGYATPLWVRTASGAPEAGGSSSAAVVTYTLTNPPAAYLSQSVSFCVRFKTSLASGTSSPTTTSTTATTSLEDVSKPPASTPVKPDSPPTPPQSSDDQDTGDEAPEENADGGEEPQSHSGTSGTVTVPTTPSSGLTSPEASGQSTDSSGTVKADGTTTPPTIQNEESMGGSVTSPENTIRGEPTVSEPTNTEPSQNSVTPSSKPGHLQGGVHDNKVTEFEDSKPQNEKANEHESELAGRGSGGSFTAEQDEHGHEDVVSGPKDTAATEALGKVENVESAEQQEGKQSNKGALASGTPTADEKAPVRRLSGTSTTKEAYLTIVVHSSAWGLVGRVGAISVYVLFITAALSFTV
ncbi:Toxoplasma gondii family A protein [Toxoplasma gondii RUB]|uniref:Toxoplasma gondii family A protein n=1 Tax=Toxoplasma gondii RUB TaxID=935652 RepID=A0A086LPN7_TOXGO|nr:Toxoplasma gondii family A protein [Toxoplasma gondii RUB]